MRADYNNLMNLNSEIEDIFNYFKKCHNDFLKIIRDGDCFDDEKTDTMYSYIKEYEARLMILKSDFLLLESENKKIESCLNPARLLKKRRLITLDSRMNKKEEDDDDLPF